MALIKGILDKDREEQETHQIRGFLNYYVSFVQGIYFFMNRIISNPCRIGIGKLKDLLRFNYVPFKEDIKKEIEVYNIFTVESKYDLGG